MSDECEPTHQEKRKCAVRPLATDVNASRSNRYCSRARRWERGCFVGLNHQRKEKRGRTVQYSQQMIASQRMTEAFVLLLVQALLLGTTVFAQK